MFIKRSEKLAIVDFESNKIKYNQLVDNIIYYSEYALNLKKYNKIKEDNFILIVMENRPEWIYSYFALWDKKYTPVVVDALSSVAELEYFIKDANPYMIITSNDTNNNVVDAIKNIESNIDILNVDDIVVDETLLEEIRKEKRELEAPSSEELGVMLYTSGTTGNPKGVMLTYNNLVSDIEAIRTLGVTYDDEQTLMVLPLHHILPLMATVLYFLYHENEYSVVMLKKLSGEGIIETLQKNDITMISGVPRLFKLFYKSINDKINSSLVTRLVYLLAKKIRNKKLSKIIFSKVHKTFGGKLRTLVAGGAKSEVEVIELFDTVGIDYFEGFGLTETSPVFAGSTKKHGYKPGTVGRCVSNAEVKIVNEELWVKGPMVMKGYYNKPEKTAEVLTEDGWFKTGDIADIDDNGFITIIGRKNSMIVLSNGKNIDPEKLENKLINLSNDLITELGIFGRNDKLCAIISVNMQMIKKNNITNIKTYMKDIVELYNSKVHNYEKILNYKIIEEELPKTRVGKLRRFMLPEIFDGNKKDEKIKQEKDLDSLEYKVIKEFLSKHTNELIKPSSTIELDLGLDSLSQVELLSFIEQSFMLKVDEAKLLELSSVGNLSKYIEDNKKGYEEKDITFRTIIDNTKAIELKSGKLHLLLRPIMYVLFKIYFRINIKNLKNIVDKPQIIISNHESFLDGFIIQTLLPASIIKKTYSLAIDWYFKSKFRKWVADNSNIILIDLNKDIKGVIEQSTNAIKQGKNILIFPEGSRTRDGKLQEFKKTYAILAKELEIDIQCLKISGAYKAMGRGTIIPRPNKITLEVLDKINTKGKTYEKIVEETLNIYN